MDLECRYTVRCALLYAGQRESDIPHWMRQSLPRRAAAVSGSLAGPVCQRADPGCSRPLGGRSLPHLFAHRGDPGLTKPDGDLTPEDFPLTRTSGKP